MCMKVSFLRKICIQNLKILTWSGKYVGSKDNEAKLVEKSVIFHIIWCMCHHISTISKFILQNNNPWAFIFFSVDLTTYYSRLQGWQTLLLLHLFFGWMINSNHLSSLTLSSQWVYCLTPSHDNIFFWDFSVTIVSLVIHLYNFVWLILVAKAN